jgi:hypothetical protein
VLSVLPLYYILTSQSITVSLLTCAGFSTLTIRSSDKAHERNAAIHQWNDPDSSAQVFVANVNTMATGVNMHTCCHVGMFLSWHLNMQTNLQCKGRLVRIGQTERVIWYMLKCADSYHDNMERMGITKWSPQISAEVNLPSWVEDELREILIFETMKTFLHQEFNRFSWVVIRDLFGNDLEYHGKQAVRLGHLFSVVAKIVFDNPDADQEFWTENMPYLLLGSLEIAQDNNELDDWVNLLKNSGSVLREKFHSIFVKAFAQVKKQLVNDPEMQKDQKKLRRLMADRKKFDIKELEDEKDDKSDDEGAPDDFESERDDDSDTENNKPGRQTPMANQPVIRPKPNKRPRTPVAESQGESSKRARQE